MVPKKSANTVVVKLLKDLRKSKFTIYNMGIGKTYEQELARLIARMHKDFGISTDQTKP